MFYYRKYIVLSFEGFVIEISILYFAALLTLFEPFFSNIDNYGKYQES